MCDANLLPTVGHNSYSIMSAPTSSGCRGMGDLVGAVLSCGGRAAPILQRSSKSRLRRLVNLRSCDQYC